MLLPHGVFPRIHGYLAKPLPDEPNLGGKTEEGQADDVGPKKKMSDESDGFDDSDDPDDKDEEMSLPSKRRKMSFCTEHSPV